MIKSLHPAAYALALAGAAYLAVKGVFTGAPTIDFKYFWLAGDLWADGLSPYSPAFGERGAEYFPDANHAQSFSYPPNWWPVSVALALFPHDVAAALWRAMSAGLTVAAIALAWRAVAPAARLSDPRVALLIGLASLMSATPLTLAMGQNAALMMFGVALAIFGALRDRRAALAAGIVILMLKPQLGAPVAAYFLMARETRGAVVIAALATVAMTLPAFVATGPAALVGGFLEQLGAYGAVGVNAAPAMTGLRHAVFLATGADASSSTFAALALAAGFAAGGLLHERDAGALALVLSATLFLSPLHTYDLMAAAPVLTLALSANGPARWIVAAGFAILFRANNVAVGLGLVPAGASYFPGSFVATVGLALMLVGALVATRRPPP